MKNIKRIKSRTRLLAMATLAAAALLSGACGSSGDIATDSTEAPAVIPSGADVPVVDSSDAEAPAFSETTDLVYMKIDGVDLTMDVFTPAGDGPWPVVVSFHGLSDRGKDDRATIAVAVEAASQGMVVFTPTWIAGNPFPVTSLTFENWDNTVSCAVAFAQDKAAEYGGDPADTVVDGFSAGAGAALLFASQEPRVAPIVGCESDQAPSPVTGFVIGDGEAWLHSENFDGAFETEPVAIQARLATLIGPSSWAQGEGAEFRIWVTENGSNPRPISDPADPSGWFAQRDPDGSIQADLERLDQFADGLVDIVDAGQLLDLRLSDAGIESNLDIYPGGHTTLDKVPEIVGYLQALAGRPE